MTAMGQAMVSAGVPVPSAKERVWRVIKEHGAKGVPVKDIIKRLSTLTPGSISVSLVDMKERGMCTVIPEYDVKLGRVVSRYCTDLDTYQNLPKVINKAAPKAHKERLEDMKREPVPVAPTQPKPADLEHLTIAQARELYNVLHKMFGGGK